MIYRQFMQYIIYKTLKHQNYVKNDYEVANTIMINKEFSLFQIILLAMNNLKNLLIKP